MKASDAAAVDTLIRETAYRLILPRFRHLDPAEIKEKAPGDFVTAADTEAEAALTTGLLAIMPGSVVIGEEAVAGGVMDLAPLRTDAPVWLIDPLDGTGNFVRGIPRFASMVALVERGVTIAGWIFDPVADWMARAEPGGGAWQDDRRLEVRHGDRRPPRWRVNRQLMRRLGANAPADLESFTYRCAGQEYLALASGAADYAAYTRLMPWDHAAGVLLHSEAGGIARLTDGAPYDTRSTLGVLLLAPDTDSWQRLNALLPK